MMALFIRRDQFHHSAQEGFFPLPRVLTSQDPVAPETELSFCEITCHLVQTVLAISASNITAPPSVCLPRLFTLICPYSLLELSQVKNTHRHTLDKGAKIHFGHILDHVTNVPASNEVLNKHTLSHRSFHARIAHKTNE